MAGIASSYWHVCNGKVSGDPSATARHDGSSTGKNSPRIARVRSSDRSSRPRCPAEMSSRANSASTSTAVQPASLSTQVGWATGSGDGRRLVGGRCGRRRLRSISRRTGACDGRRTEQQQWYQRRAPSGGGRETTNHPYSLAHRGRSGRYRCRHVARPPQQPITSTRSGTRSCPVLHDYIAIPNVQRRRSIPTGASTATWQRAVDLIADWCAARPIPGAHRRGPRAARARTPIIVMEIPATDPAAGSGPTTRCCSTATSTSSPRWRAGATGSARGRRCSTATVCTGGAAPTTGTRRSPASPRSRRSTPPAARTPAASC